MDKFLKFWSSEGCELLNQWGQPKDYFDLILTSTRNRNHSRQIYEKIPHDPNSSAVNPRIRSCTCPSTSTESTIFVLSPDRKEQQTEKRNRPHHGTSDRLPCDHIFEITVPRDHATKIATCLILRGVAARGRVLVNLVVITGPERIHTQFPVLAARFCERSYSLHDIVTLLLGCKETHRSCRRTLWYAFAHVCI